MNNNDNTYSAKSPLGNLGVKIGLILLSLLFCIPCSAGDPFKFDYFFLEAIRLKQKNEHTNAFNTLQYALKIDSTSSAALYEISHYYLFLKKDKLALDALKKAVFYSPDNFEYKMALADLSRESGQIKESIALYEELAKENPGKPDLHYYLSNLYLQQHDIGKAIEALNALENNLGVNETISLQKYQLYKSENKKEEALREIENLADKFPTEAKYQIVLGDFYLGENQTDKALLYYEKAAKIDPDDPYYFIAMSNYYEHKGEEEAAFLEIEKALKNPSLDIETKLGILGRHIQNLYTTKKDVESANALFETLMEQHSQDKELNGMYGQFLLSQDKIEEAKFQFQVVTEAMPEDLNAWTQLLDIALKEENTDEIISICENALVYFPDVPEFYLYKGIAYQFQKEYTKALDIYKEGLAVIPADNKPLLSNFMGQIADIYFQSGDKEEAFAFYDKALRYNDKNILVLNNYAYYLSLEKEELDKAERMAAKVVQIQPDNATYIDTYAWIFFQKGNYSLAKFYIESAISKIDVPSGDILEHYGDILYKMGNTDKAVSEWERALMLKEEENEDTEILRKKIADKVYYE
jgi:tetratricopeptide (TPR) repeat protein